MSLPPQGNDAPSFARTDAQAPRTAPNSQLPPPPAYPTLAPQQQARTPMTQPQPEFVQGSSLRPSRPVAPQFAVQQPTVQPHLPRKMSKPRAPRKQAAKGKGKRKAETIDVH